MSVRKSNMAPLRAVSLFSNCGAGDIGFAQAGFTFDVFAELDPRRLKVALLNHPGAAGVPGDLRETLDHVVNSYRQRAGEERLALLAACPPCQGMSSAQSGRGLQADADAGSRDSRNLLVEVIANAVSQLEPRVIVVENVQAFLTRQVWHPLTKKAVSAANFLIETLSPDYRTYPMLADLADFGVPQMRKRSFLTLIRNDEPCVRILDHRSWAPYPWPSHSCGLEARITLEQALSSFDLPPLDAGTKEGATSDKEMHSVPVWPRERYEMVGAIAPRSGRSAWQNDRCGSCGCTTEDMSQVRCGQCQQILPRPIIRDESGTLRLIRGFRTSYRRMDPDLPASTITTASGHLGSDRTIHPWQNRVMSPLECALLQTFPTSFQWGDALERWGHTHVRAMIGEAVPPLFTKKHGRVLVQLLRSTGPRVALPADDSRVRAAQRTLERSSQATSPLATGAAR